MNYDLILIRYGEISLKSSYVRKQFELTLIQNIKNAFTLKEIPCKITSERGRIYVQTDEITKGLSILKRIFGITSFSPVFKTSSEFEKMTELALDISQNILNKKKNFALRVTRTGTHKFTSQEVAVKIGNSIVQKTKASVDLTNPDFEIFIEIRNDYSFFFTEKIRGTAGFPSGTQGKIIAIITNIQSILAAWYLMRRGCTVVFICTTKQIYELTQRFIHNWFVDSSTMFIEEKKNITKILHRIAIDKSCNAIVTGHTIYENSDDVFVEINELKKHISLPLLQPLISMKTEEIIKKCREIGLIS
jgi:thiamine biosynthesis protein ThiI